MAARLARPRKGKSKESTVVHFGGIARRENAGADDIAPTIPQRATIVCADAEARPRQPRTAGLYRHHAVRLRLAPKSCGPPAMCLELIVATVPHNAVRHQARPDQINASTTNSKSC
jgi:hypothetical protein